jgi:hypothetical protein
MAAGPQLQMTETICFFPWSFQDDVICFENWDIRILKLLHISLTNVQPFQFSPAQPVD